MNIKLSKLDKSCQTRVACDKDIVAEYAEAMANGAKFPDATVFSDGTSNFVSDGFHRIEASEKNGFVDIGCDVKTGTRQDALRHALGANSAHGLRRSNSDKQHCVEIALKEFGDQSNRSIATMCGVSDVLVNDVRSKTQVQESGTSESPKKRTGKDGKKYPSKKVKKAKSSPSTKDNAPDILPDKVSESESEPTPEQPLSIDNKWKTAMGVPEGWQPPEDEATTAPSNELEEDSKTLSELKVLWMLATKAEKSTFWEWASAN